jgi:hypothetical protein
MQQAPMPGKTGQDNLPEIGLRVPGRWNHPYELERALPTGYRLAWGRLVMPDGTSISVFPQAADEEFPRVFATACGSGPSGRERRRVEGYTVNMCLCGPGGSLESAGTMIHAAAAVVRAGGIGVFVDNGAKAHLGHDWLRLAEDPGDCGLFRAFVSTYRSADDIWSVGMHVLGLRDGVIRRSGDDDADQHALLAFLGYSFAPDCDIADGDLAGDETGPQYRLRREPCARLPATSPMHNHYGLWRLVPLDEPGEAFAAAPDK